MQTWTYVFIYRQAVLFFSSPALDHPLILHDVRIHKQGSIRRTGPYAGLGPSDTRMSYGRSTFRDDSPQLASNKVMIRTFRLYDVWCGWRILWLEYESIRPHEITLFTPFHSRPSRQLYRLLCSLKIPEYSLSFPFCLSLSFSFLLSLSLSYSLSLSLFTLLPFIIFTCFLSCRQRLFNVQIYIYSVIYILFAFPPPPPLPPPCN